MLDGNVRVASGLKHCSMLFEKRIEKEKSMMAVIIGDDELTFGYLTVKNIGSKEMRKVDVGYIMGAVREMFPMK